MKKGIECHDFGGSFSRDHNGTKHYYGEGILKNDSSEPFNKLMHINLLWNNLKEIDKQIAEARVTQNKAEIKTLTEKRKQMLETIKNAYIVQ